MHQKHGEGVTQFVFRKRLNLCQCQSVYLAIRLIEEDTFASPTGDGIAICT